MRKLILIFSVIFIISCTKNDEYYNYECDVTITYPDGRSSTSSYSTYGTKNELEGTRTDERLDQNGNTIYVTEKTECKRR